MSQVWLYILGVMVGGSVVKSLFMNWVIWIAIDVIVFGLCYLILKRFPFINLRRSLMFLGVLTIINVLVDANIVNGLVANLLLLGVVVWMLFGGGNGPKRPKLRHKWHK